MQPHLRLRVCSDVDNTITINSTLVSSENTTISIGGAPCTIITNLTSTNPEHVADLASVVEDMFSLLEFSPAKSVNQTHGHGAHTRGAASALACVIGHVFAGRHRLEVLVDGVGLAVAFEGGSLGIDVLPTVCDLLLLLISNRACFWLIVVIADIRKPFCPYRCVQNRCKYGDFVYYRWILVYIMYIRSSVNYTRLPLWFLVFRRT